MAPRPRSDPRTAQVRRVDRALARLYPEAVCALHFHDPFELLVATILSAQCTDVRVNQVTPGLFRRYPGAEDMAHADLAELETLIHSTGFFRAKARNLKAMAGALVERHGGQVPRDLEALTALPGVGRKTAHVVLGNGFGIASGVVVDTHVKRLARRLGLADSDDPARIERELAERLPRTHWINVSHRLIEHGRRVCLALRPRCATCGLAPICPREGVKDSAATGD